MAASINGSINGPRKSKASINLHPASSPEVLFEAQQGYAYFEALMESARAAGALIPWKRTLLACLAAFATAYGVYTIFAPFISAMFVGALAATGSMFLSYCFMILGAVLAIYAAAKLGQMVGSYIATGDIDRDIAKVWNMAKGLFRSK